MKKLIAFISAAVLLVSAFPALAETTSDAMMTKIPSSMKVRQMVNINPSGEAMLAGTVKSIGTNSLVVSSWGGDWTINWMASTSLMRKFDGKASLSEMVVGDMVQVKGRVSTAGAWTVDARSIQDDSIQTRSAAFFGMISNLNGSVFTLTSKGRGALQVTVNADAKIMVGGNVGSLADLVNGAMVYVSGVWNTQNSTVMASKVMVMKKQMEKTTDKGSGGTVHNE